MLSGADWTKGGNSSCTELSSASDELEVSSDLVIGEYSIVYSLVSAVLLGVSGGDPDGTFSGVSVEVAVLDDPMGTRSTDVDGVELVDSVRVTSAFKADTSGVGVVVVVVSDMVFATGRIGTTGFGTSAVMTVLLPASGAGTIS